MITEDYVSVEVAKLLKEKGFDCECYGYYDTTKHPDYMLEHSGSEMDSNDGPDCYISAPTLQMAMKWLRETKDWHIVLAPMFANDINRKMVLYGYDWEISSPSREQTEHSKDFLPNYEKSCEAAIKYCLENLI